MAVEARPIHREFAAEIDGIDLARSVDPTLVDRIWEAIDRYAVLVFHDQHLDDEGLRNFAGNFGELIVRSRRTAAGARHHQLRQ
jgi:alpha-ketoglutarate-dependent 2,4-dichlorophenoxyacetate dioxygenase